jgi:hypothetical protein
MTTTDENKVFTLNEAGARVAHKLFGNGALCGWDGDGEATTLKDENVTCRDCRAATPTPGYNHRLQVWFGTDRRSRKVAWHWCVRAHRAIRLPLLDAEMMVAQDQADEIPGHPMKPRP